MAIEKPTQKLVTDACDQFDKKNETIEQALTELFGLYPTNDNPSQVLLKVAALNSLYRTQIYAFDKVAEKISANAIEIDQALAAGSPELIAKIATLEIGGKMRVNYSFATKYCSWHRQHIFAIWDSRVDLYLWQLQKQDRFAPNLKFRQQLWDYPRFLEAISAFRDHYGLQEFNLKQLDKFLFTEGEKLTSGASLSEVNSDPQSIP